MCGIVGYIGSNNAIQLVLEGLKRLEYRGYDSAGICIHKPDEDFEVVKKVGKLENLEKALAKYPLEAMTAIGHTRWATHGAVTDFNAHPHVGKDFALVHNGIIENARELKDGLDAEFKSETDSEAFLALLHQFSSDGFSFKDAILKAFSRIEGNSALVILDKKTGEMAAIKRAAPLVLAINSFKGELLASSDPYALTGFVDKIFFPEDEVLAISNLNDKKFDFFDLEGNPSKAYEEKKQDLELKVIEKGTYDHFMLKEIFEQPHLIRELLPYYQTGIGRENVDKMVSSVDIQRTHIVACGTAYHAGLIIKKFLEGMNHINTFVELASEFRYNDPLIKDKDGGVFISQSGETADTLAAQQLCTEKGIPTLAIVNVHGSTLDRDCDFSLPLRAGQEIGVASTKAFTQQVLVGFILTHATANKLDSPQLATEMNLLADRIEELLQPGPIAEIQKIAQNLVNYKGYLFTGRGKYYPIALEGALKLKEIAYVHAEGYAAGELKHGPIALIDDQMVNIALVGPELYDKTISNIEEVKARKGLIVTVGPKNDRTLETISDYYVPLNFDGLTNLSPLLMNVVLQLLSYYIALTKGTDIDKPRNLAKSVTVE